MYYLVEIENDNGFEYHVTNDIIIANRCLIIEKSNDKNYIYQLLNSFK